MTSARSWKPGNLNLSNRIILAPVAGVTSSPFRRICREFGCAMVHTEMVNARGWVNGNRHTLEYLRFHESERPVSVQIYDSDPVFMGKAARLAAEFADAIDINMGCPAPKVTRTGAGGALLGTPALAGEIMKAVVDNAGGLPVTVKMRAGWNDANADAFMEIAKLAEDNGISAITLHPRTVKQSFSGKADWGRIGRLVRGTELPVMGSGDIFTPTDARDMLERTGCAGVMLARGVFGNPWLIRDTVALLAGKSAARETVENREIISVALRHARLNAEFFGEANGIKDFRKHLLWYLKGRIPRERKPDISRLCTLEDVEGFLEENFKEGV